MKEDFNVVIPALNMTDFDWDLVGRIVMDKEPFKIMPREVDIYDVLLAGQFFPSKNEARRNWKGGDLKDGLNDWAAVGKYCRRLFVHKMPEKLPELIDADC